MKTPTVHLNGTSADVLFEQVCEAAGALRRALAAIEEAAPHGRDYYPQGSDALREAVNEHVQRVNKVKHVLEEYQALAEVIADARDAKANGEVFDPARVATATRLDKHVKLRMKVWTDENGKRWLVAGAMATRLGGPMKAYAMRDAETKLIDLTPEQWNAMPYSIFEETAQGVASPGVRNQDIVNL